MGFNSLALRVRILVTGGRAFGADGKLNGPQATALARASLVGYPSDAVLVHGAADGADSIAANVWEQLGRKTEAHPADWMGPCRPGCRPGHRRPRGSMSYCPAAGVYRNQEMLDTGVDVLVAFPGGRGTKDMTTRALAANIEVVFVTEEKINGEGNGEAVQLGIHFGAEH